MTIFCPKPEKSNDLRTLLKDAQELFREATTATGAKADELRNKGFDLLDHAQSAMVEKGKAAAASADDFIHENPWRAVAFAAGIGLLIGLVAGRGK